MPGQVTMLSLASSNYFRGLGVFAQISLTTNMSEVHEDRDRVTLHPRHYNKGSEKTTIK
jgi:hypothetical protein